jgi:hypothetical protein
MRGCPRFEVSFLQSDVCSALTPTLAVVSCALVQACDEGGFQHDGASYGE